MQTLWSRMLSHSLQRLYRQSEMLYKLAFSWSWLTVWMVTDGRVPWSEAALLSWLVLIQCVKHFLQEDVKEYLVDDGKKANGAVVLDVGHITFLVEENNSCVLPRARDTAFRYHTILTNNC